MIPVIFGHFVVHQPGFRSVVTFPLGKFLISNYCGDIYHTCGDFMIATGDQICLNDIGVYLV